MTKRKFDRTSLRFNCFRRLKQNGCQWIDFQHLVSFHRITIFTALYWIKWVKIRQFSFLTVNPFASIIWSALESEQSTNSSSAPLLWLVGCKHFVLKPKFRSLPLTTAYTSWCKWISRNWISFGGAVEFTKNDYLRCPQTAINSKQEAQPPIVWPLLNFENDIFLRNRTEFSATNKWRLYSCRSRHITKKKVKK